MNNPKILLADILKLKTDLEAQEMNLTPGLAGMYGEILVFQKMKEIFTDQQFEVKFFAGQKGADIQLVHNKKIINIEIKTSRIKDEGFGMWQGAALNIKKCRSGEHTNVYNHPKRGEVSGDFCYFDFLIFVALDESFSEPRFFVIPRSFIEKNEVLFRNTHKRFSSATHRIIISDGVGMPNMDLEQKKLIKATEAFKDRWDQIKEIV